MRRNVSMAWLVLSLCAAASAARANEVVRPRALEGWQVSQASRLRLTELDTQHAPSLPLRSPHSREAARANRSSGCRIHIAPGLLARTLSRVNAFLPAPFVGDFQIWIFEGVPYAAKAFDFGIVASRRAFCAASQEQLEVLLGHELHHVSLFRRGFAQTSAARGDQTRLGLLVEGAATWMTVVSGRFPQMARSLSEPGAVESAFDTVRDALGETQARGLGDLFAHEKPAYLVGTFMIRRIEEQFGRKSWRALLEQPPLRAADMFVDLYHKTAPPGAYRL